MKKILSLLVFSFLTYTTFAQSNSKFLVGSWKIDIKVFAEKLEQEAQKELNEKLAEATTDEQKEEIKKEQEQAKPFLMALVGMMENITITFNTDGTMSTEGPKSPMGDPSDTEVKKGTWNIASDGVTLTTKMEDKPTDNVQKIVSISSDKLVMENTKAPENSPMRQMSFVRIQE